jgi:FkbH-like protein
MIQPEAKTDFMLWGPGVIIPEAPPHPVSDYDFQIVQLPIRPVTPDSAYYRLSYQDVEGYAAFFADAIASIDRYLAEMMRWNDTHGMLTFVTNFLVPQANPMGRHLPRADLRNPVYFVEKLNEHLARYVDQKANASILDVDAIVSAFGRRHFRDDVLWPLSHGSGIGQNDEAHDRDRLEPSFAVSEVYPSDLVSYICYFWSEAIATLRTARQEDAIKLIIFDIDDTLWRGIAAERPEGLFPEMDGWPMGLTEAIGYLKRRGIVLAIVSKNTEARIEELWPFHHSPSLLRLDDFAVRKINWRAKAENITDVLRETNLLARNTLFVDDNPVEREAVKSAFPDIRTLGGTPYLWRRILLWSSETQVQIVTSESSARTEMIQAKVQRDVERQAVPRHEWLTSLSVEVVVHEIGGSSDPRYQRTLELLNKTNQFNTTGIRWTSSDMQAHMLKGLRLFAFEARDKHSQYGLIAVGVVDGTEIAQFVMSCRVVGLDVELAAINSIVGILKDEGLTNVTAIAVDTNANLLSRDLYARCGFSRVDRVWMRTIGEPNEIPEHIKLRIAEAI